MNENDHIIWGRVETVASSDSPGSSDDPPTKGRSHPDTEARNRIGASSQDILEGVALLEESNSSSSVYSSVRDHLPTEEIEEKDASENGRESHDKANGRLRRAKERSTSSIPLQATLQEEPEDLVASNIEEEDDILDSEELTESCSEEEEVRREPQYSKGSKLHGIGRCKPCHYVTSRGGCFNGVDCPFCHLSHPRKSRPRPCKTKREQCKRIVDMLEEVADKDPGHVQDAVSALGNRGSYLNRILKKRLRSRNVSSSTPGRASQKASSSRSSRSLEL